MNLFSGFLPLRQPSSTSFALGIYPESFHTLSRWRACDKFRFESHLARKTNTPASRALQTCGKNRLLVLPLEIWTQAKQLSAANPQTSFVSVRLREIESSRISLRSFARSPSVKSCDRRDCWFPFIAVLLISPATYRVSARLFEVIV